MLFVLTLIFALSTFMWYIIDKFKNLWGGRSWSKYVTIGVSAVFGFGLAFGFKLDVIYSLELVNEVSIMGHILTGLTLMSGSSAVAEVMEKIKG